MPPTPTGSPKRRASPKSATLIVPRLFIRRLLVLRSRCRIQFWWQWATAERSCRSSVLTSDCRNGFGINVKSDFRSCSILRVHTFSTHRSEDMTTSIPGIYVEMYQYLHCRVHIFDSLENQSPNSFRFAKLVPDMRNCNNDHSSVRLFCKGVPVKSNLRNDLNINRIFHR